jgi:hypothetical protein
MTPLSKMLYFSSAVTIGQHLAVQWIPVNWGSRLFGANPGEKKI